MNKKNILLNISEILIGGGSAVGTSTMGLTNPSVGIVLTSGTNLLWSCAILITNEYISKITKGYTKVKDWFIIITVLYEKTLKTSMMGKKIDGKEAIELKKIYNHYLEKRDEIMTNTSVKAENVFGNKINEDSSSPEQITKPNNFLVKVV